MGRTFAKRAGAPFVIIDGCIECGICERVCPYDAIFMSDDFEFVVDGEKCPGCRRCYDPCPVNVVIPMDDPRAVAVRESNKPFMFETWPVPELRSEEAP
jgi:MinD superfamily P-loop ATPase